MNKEEELKKSLQEYAESAGIKFNPNEKIVDAIIVGLLRNNETKGDIYCPCRIPIGDKEKDKEIACPCIFHKKEISDDGHCKCNLFVRG